MTYKTVEIQIPEAMGPYMVNGNFLNLLLEKIED